MDVNLLRTTVMVLSLASFAGIWIWAWKRSNRERFDEAAHLPFVAEASPQTSPGERP